MSLALQRQFVHVPALALGLVVATSADAWARRSDDSNAAAASTVLDDAAHAHDRNEVSTPSSAAPLAVTTRITPDPSHIADRLLLEVTVAYPAGYTVNLPTGVSFAPMHRLEVEALEPEPTGQGLRRVFRIALQHFSTGEATVPGFALTYVDPDGQVKTHSVAAQTFSVDALLANEADPSRKGEDPARSLVYPNERAQWVILASALALVIGALGSWLYLRWRSRTVEVPVVPPRPAHEIALEALQRLESRTNEMLQGERQILYFLELTEILKGYLQRRFAVEALDRTTEELRRELIRSTQAIAPLHVDEVVKLLQSCDLIKFARQTSTPSEALAALMQVRRMVEISRPIAVATPSVPAGHESRNEVQP
jgi:hypothetical protein